ncbi:MAG: FkbM family methyltransferase [Candidatus Acidiferrales bacterium]
MNSVAPVTGQRKWTHALPSPIRDLFRPLLHAWQHFYDISRGKWRIYQSRRREEKVDATQHRAILAHATPIVQDVGGVRFVLYPFDEPNLLELARHPADVAEFGAIPRLVRAGDVAFDVGANIGFYSVLLSRLCGLSGRVWAFEPVPDTYWRLRETLALNRCDNVSPVQAAVCDRQGDVRMNLFDPQHAEWNSMGVPVMDGRGATKASPSRSITVPACTLDEFCDSEKIERINFLKVDVEGFEMSVFAGAKRLLQEHRVDYICFEISRNPLKAAGFEARNVFETLETYGYFSYALEKTTGRFSGPLHDTSEDWTNFFASVTNLTRH